MKKIIYIITAVFFCMAGFVHGAEHQPLDELKVPMEKAISILKDPQYQKQKEAQREKIWEIVNQTFDFKAISMRTLAKNWKLFSDKQKEEFTSVFTELLKNTYIDKIQGEFHNEEIIFTGQDIISSTKARVNTKILREKIEIPMDYSMSLSNDKWMIYDVNIEGVSLVKNYRNQFKEILAKETPAQLIQRLKEKNEKHEQDRIKEQD
ncbi:Intermembrane phospholipid transport system binding protein [Desulfonema limicola]|uniref:Intermembrane phospholipid transport system binding protein n=1 Tax=Desulfonema limicola TaxID=45656 RepID=A0A975B5B7_9BACT|nr:ABC transporter substrate-binding protein [Desulfonema limicola]QTA79067.1 Intermembrane phospholipid transport system binding protein [Desulfonema limicola]